MSQQKKSRRNPSEAPNLGNVHGKQVILDRLSEVRIKAGAEMSKSARERDIPKKRKKQF